MAEMALENIESLDGVSGVEEEEAPESSPEVQEETSQTPPSQEPEPAEDNAEKSRLGRKVKSLEEEVRTLTRLLQEQKEMMMQLLSRNSRQEVEEEVEEEVPDVPTTRDDVLQIIQWYEKQKEKRRTVEEQRNREVYEKTFATTLSALLEHEDASIRSDIYQVWRNKYNVAFTGDPAVDAVKGFMLARNDVLKSGAYKGRAETPQQPTVGSRTPTSRTVKLSPEAERLARFLNFSDEDIEAAMGSSVVAGSKYQVKQKK